MQKLFSMFPGGAPGLALVLLRLFVGTVLVADAVKAVSALNMVLVCVLADVRSRSLSASRHP